MVGLKAGFGVSTLFSGSTTPALFGFIVGLKAGLGASALFPGSTAPAPLGFIVGLKAGFEVPAVPGDGVALPGFIVGRNAPAEAAFIADCIGSEEAVARFTGWCFP